MMRNLLRLVVVAVACALAAPASAETITLSGLVVDASVAKDPRSKQAFTTPAGETGSVNIVVTHFGGGVYDLTGGQLLLTVKKNGTTTVISRQATIDVAASGTAHFPLVVADTLSLFGPYTYDVWLTDPSGNRYQVVTYSPWTVTQAHGQPGQAVTVPATQQPLAQGPMGLLPNVVTWKQSQTFASIVAQLPAGVLTIIQLVDDGTGRNWIADSPANLDYVQIVGANPGNDNPSLEFKTGFSIHKTLWLVGVFAVYDVTIPVTDAANTTVLLYQSWLYNLNGVSVPAFVVPSGGFPGVQVQGYSSAVYGGGTTPVFRLGNGCSFQVTTQLQGSISARTVGATNPDTATALLYADGTAANDPAWAGAGVTPTAFPQGNAFYQKYTATTSGNWLSPPNSVGMALDAIAATGITKPAATWTTPTLLNSWSAIAPVGYFKDALGFVHLKGGVQNGGGASTAIILQLPAGYRPSAIKGFAAAVPSGTVVQLNVDSSGNVFTTAATAFVSLDQVYFFGDQ